MSEDKQGFKKIPIEETEQLFYKAAKALMEEKERSLRDPKVWKDQILISLTGVMKGVAIIYGIAVVIYAAYPGDGRDGWTFGFIFGATALPIISFIYPRFMFRNLFQERADAAFDRVINEYKKGE